MTLIPNFESQSHFFTPVALAVNERPPSSIVDQRFVFQTNGVAIVNMPGQTLQSLFDGLLVDLAVRDSDAVIHRISYHITVQGRIRFVTGLT